jgi:hypothetical protein
MTRAVIDRYPVLDTLSTWALGATGLAAAFSGIVRPVDCGGFDTETLCHACGVHF